MAWDPAVREGILQNLAPLHAAANAFLCLQVHQQSPRGWAHLDLVSLR